MTVPDYHFDTHDLYDTFRASKVLFVKNEGQGDELGRVQLNSCLLQCAGGDKGKGVNTCAYGFLILVSNICHKLVLKNGV